jgi:hypothetical protein
MCRIFFCLRSSSLLPSPLLLGVDPRPAPHTDTAAGRCIAPGTGIVPGPVPGSVPGMLRDPRPDRLHLELPRAHDRRRVARRRRPQVQVVRAVGDQDGGQPGVVGGRLREGQAAVYVRVYGDSVYMCAR